MLQSRPKVVGKSLHLAAAKADQQRDREDEKESGNSFPKTSRISFDQRQRLSGEEFRIQLTKSPINSDRLRIGVPG